jgi:hypothetical protein
MFRKQQLKVTSTCTTKTNLELHRSSKMPEHLQCGKNHCTLLSGLMAVGLWACLPPTPLCVLITA